MGVKLTRYGRKLAGGKKRKRTVLPTRKQAMSYRHKSIHNTAICPEGQRKINGACTDASGVGFNNSDLSGNNFSPSNNSTIPESVDIDYNEYIPMARQILSQHAPHWFKQKTLPKSHLIIAIELAHLYSLSSDNNQFRKWTDMLTRANQLSEERGQAILNVIVNESEVYQNAVRSKLEELDNELGNDNDEENQVYGFAPIFLILIVLWLLVRTQLIWN